MPCRPKFLRLNTWTSQKLELSSCFNFFSNATYEQLNPKKYLVRWVFLICRPWSPYSDFQAPRIKTKPQEKQFLLTGTLDKLSEGLGRKKWNSRYFVLEAHWIKYYHDDEKIGDEKNIDMKQVQNVTILSDHQSRENVLAVSFGHFISDCFQFGLRKIALRVFYTQHRVDSLKSFLVYFLIIHLNWKLSRFSSKVRPI